MSKDTGADRDYMKPVRESVEALSWDLFPDGGERRRDAQAALTGFARAILDAVRGEAMEEMRRKNMDAFEREMAEWKP